MALSNFFQMIADLTHAFADRPTGADRFECLCGSLNQRWPDGKGGTVAVDRGFTVFAVVKATYFLAQETRNWFDVKISWNP